MKTKRMEDKTIIKKNLKRPFQDLEDTEIIIKEKYFRKNQEYWIEPKYNKLRTDSNSLDPRFIHQNLTLNPLEDKKSNFNESRIISATMEEETDFLDRYENFDEDDVADSMDTISVPNDKENTDSSGIFTKTRRSSRFKSDANRLLLENDASSELNKKGSIEKTKKAETSNNEVKIPSRHSRSIFNSGQIQHMKESYLVKK